MNKFSAESFFDLTFLAFADLFARQQYVWDVLTNISQYLDTLSLGKIECQVPNGVYLINADSISIGKETVLEPGAYIQGPCFIGSHCTVRHGAYIRGNVIAADYSVIGHDSEIKNSILLKHAHAAHFAYVGDSILGNYVNLGAGTKCANLRLDRREVIVDGIRTGLKKFGAILGDKTQLGCNTVTNPGTITGKSVYSYPCVNFGGYIPEEHVIKSSTKLIVQPIKSAKNPQHN